MNAHAQSSKHPGGVMPGIGSMPALVTGGQSSPQPVDQRFLANEGVPPLSHAFSGKLAVHPGLGGAPVTGEAEQQAHVRDLLARERTGTTVAYIHVPFCQTHCLYCGFYNKAYSPQESAVYADTLIAELALWRGQKCVESGPVHAVYLGGGTPTALEPDDLRRILKAVAEALPLANDCEITVEGRLSNFGPEKMEACLEGGANRFSLGVQSFHTDIRRSMGRLGSREDMEQGIARLLSYDQAAVIVDLIYGFPNQDMDRWLEDLAVAQSLGLDGADCYQLNVYRNAPLGRAIEEGKLPAGADLPQQSAMFAAGVESMQKAFFRRLSLTHWARTSRERNLYNQYVKGQAHCLAFGPGAGGNIDGHFYINGSDYARWKERVAAGIKPLAMVMRPGANYRLMRAIAEGLEHGWLDLAALKTRYGVDVQSCCGPVLAQWRKVGLVELEGDKLVLTLAGQFWQVNLSQLLQEYLNMQMEKSNG